MTKLSEDARKGLAELLRHRTTCNHYDCECPRDYDYSDAELRGMSFAYVSVGDYDARAVVNAELERRRIESVDSDLYDALTDIPDSTVTPDGNTYDVDYYVETTAGNWRVWVAGDRFHIAGTGLHSVITSYGPAVIVGKAVSTIAQAVAHAAIHETGRGNGQS